MIVTCIPRSERTRVYDGVSYEYVDVMLDGEPQIDIEMTPIKRVTDDARYGKETFTVEV